MSEPILTEQNLLDAINYMRSDEHRKQQEAWVANNQKLIGEVFYRIRYRTKNGLWEQILLTSPIERFKRKIKQLKYQRWHKKK